MEQKPWLAAADAELARRDEALPGLALLLDPKSFVGALNAALPTAGIKSAEITYVRYKPGVNCLVGYQLRGAAKIKVHARAHRPDAHEKFLKVQEKPGLPGPLGAGRFILEDHAVTVSVFPNDFALKALRRVGDPAARKRLLRKILPGRPALWEVELQTLNYKPERRYVGRIRGTTSATAVVKVHTKREFEAIRMSVGAFRSSGPLRVARVLGRSRRHRVLVHEWLSGQVLKRRLGDADFQPESVRLVGKALAELHRQPAHRLAYRPPEDIIAGLEVVCSWLGELRPHLGRWAKALTDEVTKLLRQLPVVDRPMHGDFHAAQVLLQNKRVAILDLDEAGRGDCVADLGNFLAHLEAYALRGHCSTNRVQRVREALLDGYRESGEHPRDSDIALYTTAGLLRILPHAFRERGEHWPAQIEALLDRAEAHLRNASSCDVASVSVGPGFSTHAHSQSHPEEAGCVVANSHVDIPVSDPFGVAKDRRMPFIIQALDPRAVEDRFQRQGIIEALSPEGKQSEGRLSAIRVTRHKPGRRCLVEFDLLWNLFDGRTTTITLIGKARASGTKEATFFVTCDLWKRGFDDGQAATFRVPQPVGLIPEFRMVLLRRAPGESAASLLAGHGGVALAKRIAEAAFRFHQAGPPSSDQHTMARELRILRERLLALAATRPEWLDRMLRLMTACEKLSATVPAPKPCGIHRDFYADHVLVDGARLYLIDFDLYCRGDPALDIGNFLGHLTEQALRTQGHPDALADCEAALENRYVELAGENARAAVRVYTTLTIARHISISTQFPDRRAFTESLLELTEERLGLSSRPRCQAVCGGQS